MTKFQGIKNRIPDEEESKGNLITQGLTTYYNEKINFLNSSVITINSDNNKFFIGEIIESFEKELIKWFKYSFKRTFSTFFNNAYDFKTLIQLPNKEDTIYQIVILLSQISFYHDITMIIASNNIILDDKNQQFYIKKLSQYGTHIESNLSELVNLFTKTLDLHLYIMLTQLVMQIKYHLEILQYLQNNNVYFIDSFEYLIIPKIMIEYKVTPTTHANLLPISVSNCKGFLDNIDNNDIDFNNFYINSDYLKHLNYSDPDLFNIIMRCFNYRVQYGFEIVDPHSLESFAITPCTQRCFISMIGAISTFNGSLLHGPPGVGKRSTIEVQHCIKEINIFIKGFSSINWP